MRNNSSLKPFIMFALNSGLCKTAELELVKFALQVPVKQVQGCYLNEIEDAYVVPFEPGNVYENGKLMESVTKLARQYNQESILLSDQERNSFLYFIEIDSWKPIGVFTRVSPSEAMDGEAWTRDGNQFWTCK